MDKKWKFLNFLAPPSTVDFLACLQSGFMDIVYPNLDKPSQDAIKDQVDPKDLSGGGVKIRAAIIEHTIGRC
jgi:hypothetical protein